MSQPTAPAPAASPKPFQKRDAKPAPNPDFVMPKPEPGDVVAWYQSPDAATWEPAVVTAVSSRSIDLSCFVKGSHDFYPRLAVRHRTDPTRFNSLDEEAGFWDFREGSKELLELLKDMTAGTEAIVANPLRAMMASHADILKRLKAIEDKIFVKRPETV